MEFEVGGAMYRAGKLDAFKQFGIAKRLLPLISAIGGDQMAEVMKAARAMKAESDASPAAADTAALELPSSFDIGAVLAPLADAISGLRDDDARYIFVETAKVTQRRDGDRWQNIWNRSADAFQYDDIDLLAMVQIAFSVMADNLTNFSFGPPAKHLG